MWTIRSIYFYTIFSTLLLFISMIGQYLANKLTVLVKKNRKNCYFIYGYNEKSILIAKSKLKETVLVDFLTSEEEENLFVKRISYVNLKVDRDEKFVDEITRLVKKGNKKEKKIIALINDSMSDSLAVVTRFANYFKDCDVKYEHVSDYSIGLMVKVFVDPVEASAYETITKNSKGRIQMINKYKVMSFDFVSNHPITEYMDDSIINYEDGSISDDTNINMIYIGFGDTNQQLFLDEFANNALYTNTNNVLHLKKINYYFFDKERSDNNLSLNHSVFRYFLESKKGSFNADDPNSANDPADPNHIPLPEVPFDNLDASFNDLDAPVENSIKMFNTLDVNSPTFYEKLFKVIDTENSYNYIHICFGDDMENYDLASKVLAKVNSDSNAGITKIFVRIRSDVLASNITSRILEEEEKRVKALEEKAKEEAEKAKEAAKESGALEESSEESKEATSKEETPKEFKVSPNLICFGMDSVVNNIDNIENEVYYKMELYRHIFYERIEYKKKNSSSKDFNIKNAEPEAIKSWEDMQLVKRSSNIYSCLNLRVKLNLIGYDLVDASSEKERVSEEEFIKKYSKDDPIYYESSDDSDAKEIKPVDYDKVVIDKNSLRNKLAQQEHMRWNLFMIMNGFIPTQGMEKIRDYEKRIHWNLTNNEGLKKQEAVSKTIQYDYQIMDSCYRLIEKHGMKIVKK